MRLRLLLTLLLPACALMAPDVPAGERVPITSVCSGTPDVPPGQESSSQEIAIGGCIASPAIKSVKAQPDPCGKAGLAEAFFARALAPDDPLAGQLVITCRDGTGHIIEFKRSK